MNFPFPKTIKIKNLTAAQMKDQEPRQQQSIDAETSRLLDKHGLSHGSYLERSGIFQHIVGLASLVFKVPVALINFADETDFSIQASVGLDGLKRVSRGMALCSYAIESKAVTVFENAKEEACLLNHPMVHGSRGFQFYAGAPLIARDGHHLGLMAIADFKPRKFEPEERQILESLAAQVVEELMNVADAPHNRTPHTLTRPK